MFGEAGRRKELPVRNDGGSVKTSNGKGIWRIRSVGTRRAEYNKLPVVPPSAGTIGTRVAIRPRCLQSIAVESECNEEAARNKVMLLAPGSKLTFR